MRVGDVIMTSTGRRGRIVRIHGDGRPVIVLESGPVAGAELAIFPDTIDRKVN